MPLQAGGLQAARWSVSALRRAFLAALSLALSRFFARALDAARRLLLVAETLRLAAAVAAVAALHAVLSDGATATFSTTRATIVV